MADVNSIDRTAMDACNALEAKLAQLEALVAVTYGNGEESTFNELSNDLRDCYMWAVADMVRDCKKLAGAITTYASAAVGVAK